MGQAGLFLPAARTAKADEMNRKVFNLEVVGRYFGRTNPVQPGVVPIDHFQTPFADQMVMPPYRAIVPHGRSRMGEAVDHLHIHQRVEHAVDGCSGNLPGALPHRLHNLVCRRVIASLEHGFQHHASLDGQWNPAPPTQRGEIFKPLGNRIGFHNRIRKAWDTDRCS